MLRERLVQPHSLALADFFSSLKKKHLAALAERAIRKQIEPQTLMYKAHAHTNELLIVKEGVLEKKFSFDDLQLSFETLHTDMAWGYDTLFNTSVRYEYSLYAGGDGAEVIAIKIYDMLQLIHKDRVLNDMLTHTTIRLQRAALTRYQQRLVLLSHAHDILHQTTESQDKLQRLLKLFTTTVNAQRGLFARFEPSTQRIHIDNHYQYSRDLHDAVYDLPEDTLLSLIYSTHKPLIVTPKTYERKFDSAPYGSRSMMLIPLGTSDAVTNALIIADKKDGEFSAEDVQLLSLAGSLINTELSTSHNRNAEKNTDHLKRTYIGTYHKG